MNLNTYAELKETLYDLIKRVGELERQEDHYDDLGNPTDHALYNNFKFDTVSDTPYPHLDCVINTNFADKLSDIGFGKSPKAMALRDANYVNEVEQTEITSFEVVWKYDDGSSHTQSFSAYVFLNELLGELQTDEWTTKWHTTNNGKTLQVVLSEGGE